MTAVTTRTGALLRVLVVSLLALTGACSHPCDALQERLCADLGAEGCATFSQAPTQFGGFVPDRYGWSRRYNGIDQCQLFGDDTNYAGHVLPQVRYLVGLRTNPATPAPQLQPIDSSAGGLGGPWLYALMPLCVIGIFAYSHIARRKLMAQHAAAPGGPGAGGPGGDAQGGGPAS